MDLQLRALADPTRREILRLASRRELPAGELAKRFRMSRPAVSQHLRVLREARLVTVRQEATRRFYRTDLRSLSALRGSLDAFWSEGLGRLKTAAERRSKRVTPKRHQEKT